MKYLPYENYTLSTGLSADEVRQRLLDNLEPERTWSYIQQKKTKPYQGSITPGGFTINRVIRYWNSFLPVITGRFLEGHPSTMIRIHMKLNKLTLVFMIFWFGVIGITSFALIVDLLLHRRTKEFSPAYFIPFGMLFFGYALVMLPFKFESAQSKRFLSELFKAK